MTSDGRRAVAWRAWAFVVLLPMAASCAARKPGMVAPQAACEMCLATKPVVRPHNRALELAKRLPQRAGVDDLRRALPAFMAEVRRRTRADLPTIYAAIAVLRSQPAIVTAIDAQLRSTPAAEFTTRLVLLEILGEMQRVDALPVLRATIWAELPPLADAADGVTPRQREEMVRVKAVQALAYLGFPDTPSPEADDEVIRVVREHPARGVRIAAIDAYMWNHRDSREAAEGLRRAAAEELHPFIERPRLRRGGNVSKFTSRSREWMERWGAKSAGRDR